MARFKPYDYKQRVMIPISFEEQIMPGTLEHAIQEVVENRLDLSPLNARFHNDETGRPAINPKILLKIVLLAYARGIVGSRRIEQACHENIIFKALTCDYVPDHATIAVFVSTLGDQIQPLFCQVLMVCEEVGLLGGTLFAIDGCKIPGNASKKWSGTFSELSEKKAHLVQKLEKLIRQHREIDQNGSGDDASDDSPQSFRKRQRDRLEKQIRRIEEFLEFEKPKIGKQGIEIKSNVIDNESAKMATSHGVIQGYNSQAVVDAKHQVIVAGLAVGEGTDSSNVAAMLPILRSNLKTLGFRKADLKGATFIGDSGYFSVENLEACKALNLDAYIPDNHFRKRDERLVDQKKYQPIDHGKFALSAFIFDEKQNVFRCPAGHCLPSRGRQAMVHGQRCRLYFARKKDCEGCSLRERCLTKRAQRRTIAIPLSGQKLPLAEVMKQKIDTPEGRQIYGKRLATVEPVFANLTVQKGLRRLTLRGKLKASVQWLLWCMVHNIEKINTVAWVN